MRTALLVASASAAILATGLAAGAEGRIPVYGPTTINAAGRYVLTRDIGTMAGTTITILAGAVDLDLNGFTVRGGDPAILAQNATAVSIHDGSVVAYEDGITLSNVNDFVLRRLIVNSGEDCAVGVTGGAGGIMEDNVIQGGVTGVCMGGSGVRVVNNVIKGAAWDGLSVSGARNHVEGNLATGNAGCGLHFQAASSSNVYRANTARGNSAAACCLGGTTDFCNEGTGNSSNGDNFLPSKM